MIAVIAILTYSDVKSRTILGVALIPEVVILLIFDAGRVLRRAARITSPKPSMSSRSMTPVTAQKVGTVDIPAGAAAVGVFMAFWSWVGFEMAPNYAEESRDPKRIVPLSLYISVVGLGIFYIIISWCARFGISDQGRHAGQGLRRRFRQLLPHADRVSSSAAGLRS